MHKHGLKGKYNTSKGNSPRPRDNGGPGLLTLCYDHVSHSKLFAPSMSLFVAGGLN